MAVGGEWRPEESIGCIWLISPGLLLANELYGLIYADLTPGPGLSESSFRYGWLSPVKDPPAGMPTPEKSMSSIRKPTEGFGAPWYCSTSPMPRS